MTAAFNKFNAFVAALADQKLDLSSDTLKVMLTNTAPLATNSKLADLVEIAGGHGYAAGGAAVSVTAASQTGGTYKLVADPVAFTASGGSIGPFRYAVLYDATATDKDLLGWWDYGSALTVPDADSFSVTFDADAGVLTVA